MPGGRLFEAGRLLTFSAFGMGAYSRWALIRGWALIRINTVTQAITGEPKAGVTFPIESFHMDVMSTIWCPNPRKRRSYWCPKPVLLELNLFLMKQFISLK